MIKFHLVFEVFLYSEFVELPMTLRFPTIFKVDNNCLCSEFGFQKGPFSELKSET